MTTMKGRINRLVRGHILKVLEYFVGQEISESQIIAGLQGFGDIVSIPSLRAQLIYLEQVGCVEVRRLNTEGLFEVWMTKLSAKGTQLLECSIPDDPGIDLPKG